MPLVIAVTGSLKDIAGAYMLEILTILGLCMWWVLGYIEESASQGGKLSRYAWLARAAKQLCGCGLIGYIVVFSEPIGTAISLLVGEREWTKNADVLLGIGIMLGAVGMAMWTYFRRRTIQSALEKGSLKPF